MFTIGISISYAFLSNALNIKGIINSAKFIGGDKLLVETILLDTVNNRYTTETLPKNVQFVSEELSNNILNLNYKIISTKKYVSSGSITFKIRNSYSVPITSGTITTSVQSSNKSIKNVSANIDNVILNPNDVATFTINYTNDISRMISNSVINATVSYLVNNNLQYYYFTLTIQV